MTEDLQSLRMKLDELDKDIVDLMNFRMLLAEEISRLKHKEGLPLEDMQRERQVLEKVYEQCHNPILKEGIQAIFQIIMDCTKIYGHLKTVYDFPFKRTAIIGWGLIGGSIGKFIHAKNRKTRLSALERDCTDLAQAKEEGIVDDLYFTLEDLVEDVDLIILAVPIRDIIPIAHQIAKAAAGRTKPLIVMDVGSVKTEITKAFETFCSSRVEFVATHPMAGSEKQGFAFSDATLFYQAPWIITPHSRNEEKSIVNIRKAVAFFGAEPIIMEAGVHDKQTALISHLPGKISSAFLNFVEKSDKTCLTIAGPGFKSFTRLAHSNPAMRQDISQANRVWMAHFLEEWKDFEKEHL